MSRLTAIRDFALESLHLLYWSYFKPYTLKAYLRDIDPDLDIVANPFEYRSRFAQNLHLRWYAEQVWWLSALAPLPFIAIAGSLYQVWSGEPFEWLRALLFLAGWWLGLWLARRSISAKPVYIFLGGSLVLAVLWESGIIQEWLTSLFSVHVFLSFPHNILFEYFLPVMLGVTTGVAGGVAFGVTSGVAFGVAGGVSQGVAMGVSQIVTGGMALGATLGLALGVPFSVVRGVVGSVTKSLTRGVALSAAFGVVFSVMFDLAFGVMFSFVFVGSYLIGILRIYFWLPETIWMLVLMLVTSEGAHARRLRYLPPYFDQVIHLPMPFLEEFIVRAYREHPQAGLETIAYLNAYTNLQKTAARCMAQIALEALQRTRSLEEIAALADEVAWLPSPLPETVSPFLPRLLEISQDLRAALHIPRGLARKAVFESAQRRLQAMHKEIILSSRKKDAGYGAVVNAWKPLLARAIQEEAALARAAGQIRNPYVAGPALDPEQAAGLLRGRADLFRELEGLLLSPVPPVLLLYGGRRTGKTSFLKFLPRTLGGDFLPLLVDLQEMAAVTTLEALACRMAEAIRRSAQRARNLSLPAWNDEALRRDPFDALLTWFDAVEKAAPQRTLLLCLDEYERLDEVVQVSRSRAVLNFLRHVMQHRPRWALLFSGSHMLDELPDYWSDYLINTRALPVSYLSLEDTRDLIEHPASDFPQVYTPEAVETIARLTRGQPYLTQLICYELVEWLNRTKKKNKQIRSEDVEAILSVVFERGGEYFREFWRLTLDQVGRKTLRHLVTQPDVPLPEALHKTARFLVRKEILQPATETPTGYVFQVPLHQLYVERIMKEDV